MAVSHVLLSLAQERPRYPYAFKTAFEDVFGDFWPLNYGQVHQSLEALTRKGQLTSYPDPDDARRTLYEITADGEAELEAWRHSCEAKVRPLRDDLYLRLYLHGRTPDRELVDIVEEHRVAYSRHLRALTEKRREAGGESPIEQLLLETAIEHTEADVRWLDRVRDLLEATRVERAEPEVPQARKTSEAGETSAEARRAG